MKRQIILVLIGFIIGYTFTNWRTQNEDSLGQDNIQYEEENNPQLQDTNLLWI